MAMKQADKYRNDRSFSDDYLAQVKRILSRNAIRFIGIEVAQDADDTQESTDMVISVNNGRVAVRVRRPSCAFRDLTIRSRSFGGGTTELEKLRAGFGDWYLYCWTNSDSQISEWILVDINKMRSTGLLNKSKKDIPNGDGTFFVAFDKVELRMNHCLISAHL